MHTKSAAKRSKQGVGRRARNRAAKSSILTVRARFLAACESGDKAKALQEFSAFCSDLDRAAKKGSIKFNNASRRKSRASALLAKVGKE